MTEQEARQGSYNELMISTRMQNTALLAVLCGVDEDQFAAFAMHAYRMCEREMKEGQKQLLETGKEQDETTGPAKV